MQRFVRGAQGVEGEVGGRPVVFMSNVQGLHVEGGTAGLVYGMHYS